MDKWEILRGMIKEKNLELKKKGLAENSTGKKAMSAKVVFSINSSILSLMDKIEELEKEEGGE